MYDQQGDWELHPLAGASGDAYMGVKSDEKVFFKRNTSPFIAALSAEGIAPKLMWTQRTFSGDTITAQEWKDGRLLKKEDMGSTEVIELIRQIHESDNLLLMLKRMGERNFYPLDFIEQYFVGLSPTLAKNHLLNEVIRHMEDAIDKDFYDVRRTVCHGDLNHNNFLKSQDNHLYLVDWESVKVADPLSDITMILVHYFAPSEWMDWFELYNYPINNSFYKRVRWYSMMNCLYLIKQYYLEGRQHKTNEYIILLKTIYEDLIN